MKEYKKYICDFLVTYFLLTADCLEPLFQGHNLPLETLSFNCEAM